MSQPIPLIYTTDLLKAYYLTGGEEANAFKPTWHLLKFVSNDINY